MPYYAGYQSLHLFLNGLEKALEKRSVREQQVLTRVLACADAMIYFSETTLGGYHKREIPYWSKIVSLLTNGIASTCAWATSSRSKGSR